MNFAALGIELIGMSCDIAQKRLRMASEPGLGRTAFERTPRRLASSRRPSSRSTEPIH
jgi:hypothetical protein